MLTTFHSPDPALLAAQERGVPQIELDLSALAAEAIARAPKRGRFDDPVEYARALIAAAPPGDDPDGNVRAAHHYYFRDLDPATTPLSVRSERSHDRRLIPELFEAASRITRAEALERGGVDYGFDTFLLGCGLKPFEAASILLGQGVPNGGRNDHNLRHLMAAAMGRKRTGTTGGDFHPRELVFDDLEFPLALQKGEEARFWTFDPQEGTWPHHIGRLFLCAYRHKGRRPQVGLLRLARSKGGDSYLDAKGRTLPVENARQLAALYKVSFGDVTLECRNGLRFRFKGLAKGKRRDSVDHRLFFRSMERFDLS